MRTTVEITDAQRAELLKIAARRREKGFSSVIREALDLYLQVHRTRGEAVKKALALQGAFDDAEADSLERSVELLRGKWR